MSKQSRLNKEKAARAKANQEGGQQENAPRKDEGRNVKQDRGESGTGPQNQKR